MGIVGAGPVGLACALRLASFGVASVVLEAEPSLRKRGSRACCVQGDVLEILHRVGCGEAIAGEGVPWSVSRTCVRDRELFRTTLPSRGGFPPFVNISQSRTEEILLERLRAHDAGSVRWSHRVVGLAHDSEGVAVTVETPSGRRRLRFGYLVACDGIHSAVRDLSGVEWTGYSHDERFLIADVRAPLRLARERLFHYDPPVNPGRQVVMHAQPDDVWRIDWQVPSDTDAEAERRSGALDRRIRAVIGEVPYEIDWASTYRFHQRVVARMRAGRVFFAGDAAHAMPPFGARGMNSGIQDVDNLAWKLGLVLRGLAADALLETYHVERHAAARENLRVTEATIRFMVPPTAPHRWRRNALLRLAPRLRYLRRYVNSGRMAEPFVYADSPIVLGGRECALSGRFAPDGVVCASGRRTRLRERLGRGFVALLFCGDRRDARAFGTPVPGPVPVDLLHVLPAGAAVEGPSEVTDDGPELRAAYAAGASSWYLVRPDGHVAAGGAGGRAAALADALRRCAACP